MADMFKGIVGNFEKAQGRGNEKQELALNKAEGTDTRFQTNYGEKSSH
jgi:hypothetical protein